jgi:hypothetical protein
MTTPMIDAAAAEAIEYICRNDWTTFVEIARIARSHGIDTKGNLCLEAVPNGVMWADMSEQFCDVIEAIKRDGRTTLDSGHMLAYLIDGGALTIPVAKAAPRDRTRGYAKPRWLVTCFRPVARVKAAATTKRRKATT